jgi:hypothetical protein
MSNSNSDEELINSTLETNNPSQQELDDFKNKMSEWLKLDEQIKKLSIAIRERKKFQSVLNVYIQDFMFKYNYNDISIDNSKIKARQKESVIPLKVNYIKDKMLEFNNLSGEELIKKIFEENRETRVRNSVTRVIPKIKHLSL